MVITTQEIKPISFNNDIFFRHSLSKTDRKSKRLREDIIEFLLHRKFDELMIIAPDITPDHFDGKDIRLDILLKDRITGEIINIEMQVSKYNVHYAKRFQYYSSRLITDQPLSGIKYSTLVTTYQIIFIDDVAKNCHQLVSRYTLKDEQGKEIMGNLTHQIYVYLPIVNEIVKDKGIEQLNEFEKLCYLFKNNRDDAIIKATKDTEGMAKILMEKYDEFAKEKELYTLARALEDGRLDMEARIADGHDEGVEEGLKQGMEQGQLTMAKKAIKKRYQQDATDWLTTLSFKQLDNIMDILLEVTDYTIFKQEVEKIK